jgi:hypothetical protein
MRSLARSKEDITVDKKYCNGNSENIGGGRKKSFTLSLNICPEACCRTKSFIEVTKCTSSNILVWFCRDAPEKSVAGLRESLISSPFEKFAKGLEKYRNNERRHWELWLNSWSLTGGKVDNLQSEIYALICS